MIPSISEIEKIIENANNIPYTKEAHDIIEKYLHTLASYVSQNHFLLGREYINEINNILVDAESLSDFESREDRLLQREIQRDITHLARRIRDENKKIFIVHGRDLRMRDQVASLLGRLKLDYCILESEYNGGATVIEKFLRVARDCRYAIVLFSGDDVGKLDVEQDILRHRARQNVVLELGYFLGQIGRENIFILHDAHKNIEKPSDFAGVVYEACDEYGAWKNKVIKELKKAKIHIDEKLAERV